MILPLLPGGKSGQFLGEAALAVMPVMRTIFRRLVFLRWLW